MQLARRPTPFVVALLALSGSVVVAGCGGSEEPGTGASPLKALDIGATPREELRDGGTVRWAVDQFSTQWNYNHLDGAAVATATVIAAVMPSPFDTDERANHSVDRDYLTSAEVTASSPNQVITYKLNPKGRWSDGKPITWSDFEAQWKALRSAEGPYLIGSSTGYERISSVARGADAYEAVVTFKRPFSEWRALFDPLYPAATNSDPKRFNEGWLNKIPVTSGPFKLDKIDKTAETVTIVRDPKWWGRPAKLDAIVARALEEDAGVNAFANGEVDVVQLSADASAYKRALGVKGGVVRQAAGPDFRHFTLNGTSEMLRDSNVRKAVAMAIDRAALAKADLSGLDWPVETLENHYFVNTQAGYRDNSGAVGGFDPAAARELLEQAGWRRDGTRRRKGGETLRLRFVVPSGIQVTRQEAELTQAMLRDVGVGLEIVTVPSDAFFDKYITPGNFDVTAFSWEGTPFPISSARSIYVEPVKNRRGELQVQQNYARTGSAEIDALMAKAEETLDVEQARELLNQADRLVWELVHSLTLYQRPQLWGVNERLANVGAFGFKTPVFGDMGFVK